VHKCDRVAVLYRRSEEGAWRQLLERTLPAAASPQVLRKEAAAQHLRLSSTSVARIESLPQPGHCLVLRMLCMWIAHAGCVLRPAIQRGLLDRWWRAARAHVSVMGQPRVRDGWRRTQSILCGCAA